MSLHLVFIGAAAGLAPAASLRALSGGGAVLIPEGLDDELCGVLREAAAASAVEVVPGEVAALLARAGAGPDDALVCIAGERGPAVARALLGEAASRGLAVTTTPAQPLFGDCLIGQELVSLRRIIGVLRRECPWDRVQTDADIVSYTIEEVFELADAIAAGDRVAQHGELGDLLMQVYFLAQLLEEREAGDVGSVATEIETKLIRRHAHIFGDAVAETPGEVRGQWERIKRDQEGREGVFHDVPESFPSVLFVRKVQQRAAAVGFDWSDVSGAFPKITEERDELAEALALPVSDAQRRARLRHEAGDLLFAVVNVARLAGVDPELALREAGQRFVWRVERAVELAAAAGGDWTTLALDDQDEYYRRAKAAESGHRAASHQEGTS